MSNNSGIHILYNKLILSIIFKHYFNDLNIEIIKNGTFISKNST